MRSVRAWLEDRSLGHLADQFEANAITFEILGTLTDDDLKSIGIAKLGERKRILLDAANASSAPVSSVPGAVPETLSTTRTRAPFFLIAAVIAGAAAVSWSALNAKSERSPGHATKEGRGSADQDAAQVFDCAQRCLFGTDCGRAEGSRGYVCTAGFESCLRECTSGATSDAVSRAMTQFDKTFSFDCPTCYGLMDR